MILMTYNIMHGLDYIKLLQKERIIDLDKIIEIIKEYNPDILALNEVYNDTKGVNQAELIASKLGYNYYFGKSINLGNSLLYGNALLSKYKIESPKTIKIPDVLVHDENVYYESRIIIKAKINNYNVFISHFGLAKKEQENAINTLRKEIKGLNNVIFMGDLNIDEEELPVIDDDLYNTSDILDKKIKTFTSISPTKKIDYIFVSRIILVLEVNVVNKIASDHLPLLVKIL